MNGLVQTVAPDSEPITLAEAKAWLRVDAANEDTLILSLITAAREHAETFTRRAFITQQFELSLDTFPGCTRAINGALRADPRYLDRRHASDISPNREITLRRPPLVSVESVKYYDSTGALQTLDPASYFVDTRAQPGRIVLNSDYDWPETQSRPNAVIIAYTAGYGADSASVPGRIRTAMRYMVTHWFINRTPVETGLRAAAIDVPHTAEMLLWQVRIPDAV